MASMQEVLEQARKLGKLVAEHDSAKKFEAVLGRLKADKDAQHLLNDYNRQLEAIGRKQSQNQPIEVEDKHRLESLRKQVVMHPLLRELQMAQMDYVDLMRQVDEAMSGEAPDGGEGGLGSVVGGQAG